MTKAELIDEVSKVANLTKKETETIVNTVFDNITDALVKGDKVELRGFGSFRIRQRHSRKGRNPKAGGGEAPLGAMAHGLRRRVRALHWLRVLQCPRR
jgi:nucleoid DNA-binding protein